MTPEQLAELFVEEQCDNTMNIHTCIEILVKNAYKAGYACAVDKTEEWLNDKAILGWHPASKLPPLDEDGESECVIGIWEEQQFSSFIAIPLPVSGYVSYEDGAWTKPIKWWCYPPKED